MTADDPLASADSAELRQWTRKWAELVVAMLGCLVLGVVLLYPPWDSRSQESDRFHAMAPMYEPLGHYPVWSPPEPLPSHSFRSTGVQLAVEQLLVEVGAVVALTVAGVLAAGLVRRLRQADPQ